MKLIIYIYFILVLSISENFNRSNKFYEGSNMEPNYQNITYRPQTNILDPKFYDSFKGIGDVRANAKTYGEYKDRSPFFGNTENLHNRPISAEKNPSLGLPNHQNYINFPNEVFIKPIYPKQFLENYLSVSKSLTSKAPVDYKYILAKNIHNLGGIEDTIGSIYIHTYIYIYIY